MANDVIQLARRFEPILHFHPQERFFPSDAKRYIEHCALWRARSPFDKKESWGLTFASFPRGPMIDHKKIAASNQPGEVRQGDKFLGEVRQSDFPFLVDTIRELRFFELAGWKIPAGFTENGEPIVAGHHEGGVTETSINRYSDRDEVARLYNTNAEPQLTNSRFWYHAELFDTQRLRVLTARDDPSLPIPDLLSRVFSRLVSRNPALLCYYFFFPAHDESLAAPCDSEVSGKEFASFAGEWACMAILLVRPSETVQYQPTWIGFTGRRNAGSLQALDPEKRIGMSVHRWGRTEVHQADLPETVGDHPKLFVAAGTHSLYLQPGTHSVQPYPPESFPQWCGQFDSPDALDQHRKSHPPPEQKSSTAAWIKILGGFRLGGVPGLLAGAAWAALEGLPLGPGIDAVGTAPDPSQPTPDVAPGPGAFGKVVHPKDLPLTDPPGAEFVKWAADENVEVAGRHYNFIVNRSAQVWWPSDDGRSGYRGRWGPLVTKDPVTRRSGMRFPEFWRMFFKALVQAAPKEFLP